MGVPDLPDRAEGDEAGFEVWAENWETVCAFIAIETQWQATATFSQLIWLGLDYGAVDVIMRRRNLPDHVFEQLQIMEGAALAVFSEAANE